MSKRQAEKVIWYYRLILGQNHLLIDFVQNLFPKFKHFDWVIAKLVLLLANQNVQIWGISFGKIMFYKINLKQMIQLLVFEVPNRSTTIQRL